MSQNKVTFGLENVHIAFFDKTAVDQLAWKAPIHIPGAVSWTPTAQGETSTFHADNMSYFVISSNNGYNGPLVIANLTDEVKAEMYGWEIDDNGMLVEIADAIPNNYALIGQVSGDKRKRKFIYYDCQSSRPEKAANTQSESITPDTTTLNITSSPIQIGGKTIVKGDLELSDTNAAIFNSFFTEVYTPTFGGGE